SKAACKVSTVTTVFCCNFSGLFKTFFTSYLNTFSLTGGVLLGDGKEITSETAAAWVCRQKCWGCI
ncbi:hypothetical protein, partial [Bacillus halotolerans]|uniref:hypothetical protein n=1 Tax=Bacillus halotolerans TaxID=260554 RepID=UPI001968470F